MRVIIAWAAVALGLSACSPSALDANGPAATKAAAKASGKVAEFAPHPVSGLPVIGLTVDSAGKKLEFRVEVATSGAEQARGLMFRTEMGEDEGMLFPQTPPRHAAFWMKNTVIPLDIIYIGTDGRVLNVVNALPYDLTPLPSEGVASGVLELVGGRAAALGIKPGDKVHWVLPAAKNVGF